MSTVEAVNDDIQNTGHERMLNNNEHTATAANMLMNERNMTS